MEFVNKNVGNQLAKSLLNGRSASKMPKKEYRIEDGNGSGEFNPLVLEILSGVHSSAKLFGGISDYAAQNYYPLIEPIFHAMLFAFVIHAMELPCYLLLLLLLL